MVHQFLQELSPLARIDLALQSVGHDVFRLLPGEVKGHQFEQLLVPLLKDESGFEYAANIKFANDIIESARLAADIPYYPDRAQTLQIDVDFPFEIGESQWGEVACLALELNRLIDFGAFGVNPVKHLYYRYSLVYESKEVDMFVLDEVLVTMAAMIKSSLAILFQYFEGKMSLDDIYEMIGKDLTQPNKGH